MWTEASLTKFGLDFRESEHSVVFHLVISQMMLSFHLRDGRLRKPETWMQLLGVGGLYLRRAKVFVGGYIVFFLPSLHPIQQDDATLLAEHKLALRSFCT